MSDSGNKTLSTERDELLAQLRAYYLRSARQHRLLGLEFECLRVDSERRAAPSRGDSGPDSAVLALGELYLADDSNVDCVEVIREAGDIAILKVGSLNFSVEPGGQIEISLPPYSAPDDIAAALDRYVERLDRVLSAGGYQAIFVGHQPVTDPHDIELRAKPRYAIMNRRLAQSGKHGIHMMRATAGMQVTLDFADEADAVSMLRAALTSAPFVTALFANSPLLHGRDSGWCSIRERAWWDTDSTRCGVPIALLAADATLDDYIDFALAADLWFLQRGDQLVEVASGRSFADVHAESPLSLADFALHSTTLFPAARLRGGVEVRSADCVPAELAKSFAPLQAGLLYDEESRQRCSDLHPYRSQREVRTLHEAAAREGLHAVLDDGFAIIDATRAMLELARRGVERLEAKGDLPSGSARYLDALDRLVAEGRMPCDDWR